MTKKISEVTVFTVGDSTKLSTWSNLPYFFTDMLQQNGIKVNRVNISPSVFFENIYNRSIRKIIKWILPDTSYDYFRSGINHMITRRKIKIKSRECSKSELNIFLTFSFSSYGISKLPCIQLCDWTYQYFIDYFLEREPDYFEKTCIKRENSHIKNSNMIVTLYPGIKEYLLEKYNNKNTFCFGNIINSLSNPSKEESIKNKIKSYDLLFIGTKKYYEAARNLLKAFNELTIDYPQLKLHIIGLKTDDFDLLPSNVSCYGYLDKSVDGEKDIFYSLMKKAKVFINTTPKWGGFSSINEAMHFYTPVIIKPFSEFVKTFGSEIDFGYYCDDNSTEVLQKNIKLILEDSEYETKCLKAHEAVKDFMWPIVANKFITKAEEIL